MICFSPSASAWDLIIEWGERAGVFPEVRTEFSVDCARCAAYFALFSEALKSREEDRAAEAQVLSFEWAEKMLEAAIATSNVEVAEARFELWLRTMNEDIGGSWDRFEIVLVKHAEFCRTLARDPHSRLADLIETEMNRRGYLSD